MFDLNPVLSCSSRFEALRANRDNLPPTKGDQFEPKFKPFPMLKPTVVSTYALYPSQCCLIKISPNPLTQPETPTHPGPCREFLRGGRGCLSMCRAGKPALLSTTLIGRPGHAVDTWEGGNRAKGLFFSESSPETGHQVSGH